jgi:hypothetical protein
MLSISRQKYSMHIPNERALQKFVVQVKTKQKPSMVQTPENELDSLKIGTKPKQPYLGCSLLSIC